MSVAASLRRSDSLRALARRAAGATGLSHLVRLAPVLALLEDLPGGELLDAGSGSIGLAPWLGPDWSVTAVDTSFDDYGAAAGPTGPARAVVGDVCDLPFPDASFDVAVALDLLEHVAPDDRAKALAELRRVARRRVIVACPAEQAAFEADRRLASTLDPYPAGSSGTWPTACRPPGEVAAALGAQRTVPNEHTAVHERLVRAELSIAWFVPTRAVAWVAGKALRGGPGARRRARRALARLAQDARPPAYRTIFVLDR